MSTVKTPQRTLFWARRCLFIERNLVEIRADRRDAADRAQKIDDLLDYATSSAANAEAEGYDDTATYILQVIDDVLAMKAKP